MQNIKIKGRKYEAGITIEYLTRLYNFYEKFMKEISKAIPVIRVNCSKFKSVKEMAKIIKKEFESMHNIKNIDYNINLFAMEK